MLNKAIIVCGTTASGKSDYAIDYALKNNGELINIDSLQVYKDLSIITASPIVDDLQKVHHHLFNIIPSNQNCSVAMYLDMARSVASEIVSRGKLPVFVGGTGFYINAILHGINELPEVDLSIRKRVDIMSLDNIIAELKNNTPVVLEKINQNDKQRLSRALEYFYQTGLSFLTAKDSPLSGKLPYEFEIHYVYRDNDEIRNRIKQRVYKMLEMGVEAEIKNFLSLNVSKNSTIYKADGVMEFEKYFSALQTKQDAIDNTIQKSIHYAKRQRTWFNNKLPVEITKKIELI